MSLVEVASPAIEPITLADAKAHLRVTDAAEDAIITALIKTARLMCETFTRRTLITTTWDWFIDGFAPVLCVPKPALQSVTSVKYIDTAGVQQTLDAAEYLVDTKGKPGRIMPAWGKTWPAIRPIFNAVEIRFVAGYGDTAADVPENLVNAMKLIVAHLFQHREDVTPGAVPMHLMPKGAEWLMYPEFVPEG